MSFYWVKPKDAGINHELIWGSIGLLMFGAGWIWPKIPLTFLALRPCPFKAFVGLPCLSCGMTRCVVAFSHGQIVEAFLINPLGGVAVAALALFTLYAGMAIIFRTPRLRFKISNQTLKIAIHVSAVAALFINWGYLIVGRI